MSGQDDTRGEGDLGVTGEVDIAIDRSSPVPLYHQVAQAIERAIHEGTLRPETKLDNEIDLARRLNISRPTLRQAMDKLVRDGLVVRRRGVGTQVIPPRVRRSLKLSSLYDDLRASGAQPATTVLSLDVIPADDDVCQRLGLSEGTEVYHLRRLRFLDKQPLAIMENYLPRSMVSLTEASLERDGLYNLMRQQGACFQMAHQSVGAAVAQAEQAHLLGLSVGAPLVTMQRVAFDLAGTAIELGNHAYRADLYSYETTLMNR